jgi:anti-anti-sigma factor
MPDSEASILHSETIDGCLVARIACPHVGQREAPIIQSEVEHRAPDHAHRVAIDFADVTMLGSLGLGALITLTKTCKSEGGKLVIFNVDAPIRELVKMSRLDRVITLCADEPEALKKAR